MPAASQSISGWPLTKDDCITNVYNSRNSVGGVKIDHLLKVTAKNQGDHYDGLECIIIFFTVFTNSVTKIK